jgi:hypothetical protein
MTMTMRVTRRKGFEGWGILRPTSHKTAVFEREATMQERDAYLKLFPAVRLILCMKRDDQWFGHPGNSSDTRFKITGLAPVIFPVEPQMFDLIISRFDGKIFWYDQVDPVHSQQIADALRERLVKPGPPKDFDISGLTLEEREAYKIAYIQELENRKDLKEERLKEALSRGGAEYRSYVERGNSYTVEYMVDGSRHRSTVNKDTLAVESAGICLTDHATGRVGDTDFDLQSLVGVIREGQGTHQIHHW